MFSSPAVGTALRAARKSAGLSHEQLAARAGLSAATVKRVEAERVRPTPATLLALRLALGDQPAATAPSGVSPDVARWAALLAQAAREDPSFDGAVARRVRAEALGRAVSATGGDVPAAGRAAAASPDRGAAMADALLDDLDDQEREQMERAATEHLSVGVAAAAVALIEGACRATLEAPELAEVDLPTLVMVGVGLVAR
jgi:transcriptional regulator with XRE-family HTH domain